MCGTMKSPDDLPPEIAKSEICYILLNYLTFHNETYSCITNILVLYLTCSFSTIKQLVSETVKVQKTICQISNINIIITVSIQTQKNHDQKTIPSPFHD